MTLSNKLKATLVRESRRLPGLAIGDHLRRRSTIAIISWIWPIHSDRAPHQMILSECRSILPPSNATCARNALHEPITCGPTCAPTPMKDRLFAPSAAKRLRDSTIGSAMKVCIPGKRNLFVVETSRGAGSGAAAAVSRVRTPWAVIFDRKPVASASGHCWMKNHTSASGFSPASNTHRATISSLFHRPSWSLTWTARKRAISCFPRPF